MSSVGFKFIGHKQKVMDSEYDKWHLVNNSEFCMFICVEKN